jgi:hypothetical protein
MVPGGRPSRTTQPGERSAQKPFKVYQLITLTHYTEPCSNPRKNKIEIPARFFYFIFWGGGPKLKMSHEKTYESVAFQGFLCNKEGDTPWPTHSLSKLIP